MIVQTERVSRAVLTSGIGRRLLFVGASTTPVCGVRDYARVVGEALRETGADVEFVWWERDEGSLPSTRSEWAAWLERVASATRDRRPDWIVWHYSAFAWGARGIPYLAPGTARRLCRLDVPILLLAHELAFPFGRAGWKGRVWATSQRLALVRAVRVSSAVIVTTEERLRWLRTRRWLPERPGRFVPVCSNVPPASRPAEREGGLVVGIFGFGVEGALVRETMEAIADLRANGIDVSARLIGAPGETGAASDRWRAAAARAGVADGLAFTGVLPADRLADALAGSDVLLLPDPGGPSARKGTLAAGLALGCPVVAADGPERWEPLVENRAVVLSRQSAEGLSRSLESLLSDPRERRAQADRGAAFYSAWMAPHVICRELCALMATAISEAVPA
jgi:glycosyltransferase involved in cell wall biosynthesis